MGCNLSGEVKMTREEKYLNKSIEKKIREAAQSDMEVNTILVYEAREDLVKHSLFLELDEHHGPKISPEEMKLHAQRIRLGSVVLMRSLVQHYLEGKTNDDKENMGVNKSDSDYLQILSEYHASVDLNASAPDHSKVADAIQHFWSLEAIQRMYLSKRKLFSTNGNGVASEVALFEDHSMWNADWEPSKKDLFIWSLMCQGIAETSFNSGELKVKLVSLTGAQVQAQGRKWSPAFQSAFAIMFVVDLSAYEDRYFAQLEKFEDLCNSKLFPAKLPVLLYLNNGDEMLAKVEREPLNSFFPEYTGKPNDLVDLTNFVKSKFLDCSEENTRPVGVQSPVTQGKEEKFKLFQIGVRELFLSKSLRKAIGVGA